MPCGKAAAQTLLNESFEYPFATSGWSVLNLGGDPAGETWLRLQNDASVPPHTGNYAAFSQDGADNYPNPQIPMEEWLVSPLISVPANSYLSLKFWQMFRWANYGDRPKYVMVSTTTITPSAFDTIITLPDQGPTSWTEVINNNITGYAGQNIYIAFVFTSGGYADAWAIDDVLLESFPLVPSDAGMLSVTVPALQTPVNTSIYPRCTIKNFGTTDITGNFLVSYNITDISSQMVFSDVIIHTGTLSAGNTDTLTFPNAWIPDTIGNFTFSFYTSLFGDQNTSNDTFLVTVEVYRHYGTGGPDAFGYRWVDSEETGGPVFNWIEISQTGTSAITYNTDGNFDGENNFSEAIPFGFNFPYYGIDRQQFHVDVNGEILLANSSWYKPYPSLGWDSDGMNFNYIGTIPGNTSMPALVAVLWDFLTAGNGTGDVYFQTFGTAPNRYCVVEWHNMRYSYENVTDTSLSFEAVFHENGEIIFQYKNVNIGQIGGAVQHDNGHSATVGIQNDAADMGLCYLKESYLNTVYSSAPFGNLLKDSLAIRFYPGEDLFPPNFIFTEKGNTFESNPEIKINITDMSKIRYDSLYFNTGSGWQAVAHSAFIYPDTFIYQLPAMANNISINYYFAATDSSVNHNRGVFPANAPDTFFTFKILPTSGVTVLLARSAITDANNIEYTAFANSFNANAIVYDVFNWDEFPAFNFPSVYKSIYVYASSASAMDRYDTLSKALMNFLDLGTNTTPKNIFMASDDFAYAGYGYANDKPMLKFFEAYLRSGYIPQEYAPFNGGKNGIGGPGNYDYVSGSIIGVANSPVGTAGVEIPVFSNSPDNIHERICPAWYEAEVTNPAISSNISFLFEDGPFGGQAYSYHNACGVWLDNLIYKSFFLSFDLSQLSGSGATAIIGNADTWFNSPTGINESAFNNQLSVYPNPSNGRFTINSAGNINSIEVYNMLGKCIHQHIGSFLVLSAVETSNRQDLSRFVGIDLSSQPKGIYFIKISDGEKIFTQKIVIK